MIEALLGEHWPGPLTVVLAAKPGLPSVLVSEAGGIGLRMSPDPVAAQLVDAVGAPITATSANRSGAPPATVATAAALAGVALVLDDGPRNNPPSTVIEAVGPLRLLRPGPVSFPND